MEANNKAATRGTPSPDRDCALDADGNLMDASQINFFNSPSDERPISGPGVTPSSPTPTANKSPEDLRGTLIEPNTLQQLLSRSLIPMRMILILLFVLRTPLEQQNVRRLKVTVTVSPRFPLVSLAQREKLGRSHC